MLLSLLNVSFLNSLTLFCCNIFVILDIDLFQVYVVSNRYKHETLETLFHSLKDLFLIPLCNIVYSLQGSIATQDSLLNQVAVSV